MAVFPFIDPLLELNTGQVLATGTARGQFTPNRSLGNTALLRLLNTFVTDVKNHVCQAPSINMVFYGVCCDTLSLSGIPEAFNCRMFLT